MDSKELLLGDRIIAEIATQGMVDVENGPPEGTIFIWNANAGEQLEAVVSSHFQRRSVKIQIFHRETLADPVETFRVIVCQLNTYHGNHPVSIFEMDHIDKEKGIIEVHYQLAL